MRLYVIAQMRSGRGEALRPLIGRELREAVRGNHLSIENNCCKGAKRTFPLASSHQATREQHVTSIVMI